MPVIVRFTVKRALVNATMDSRLLLINVAAKALARLKSLKLPADKSRFKAYGFLPMSQKSDRRIAPAATSLWVVLFLT